MTISTVTAGKDSWVDVNHPNRTHAKARKLRVDSGEAFAFIHLKSPVPRGSTVTNAKLQVYVAGTSWSGTKTVKLRRVASRLDWSDLTWNNKPGVTGASQPTVTVTGAVDGQLLEFDVTNHLQTVADGDPHYGWRLETDSTTPHRVYSFDSDHPPKLVVTHSGKPGAPTDLSPDGGAVSVAKPVLRFTAPDLNSEDDLVALRVWIDPTAPGSAPAFDSGEIATTVPELDLSTTAYAGLADGATTKWKVWWKNSSGVQSEWSDWATFSRANKPALTIGTPSGLETVTTVTPPLEATLGSGTLKAWMVRVVDPANPARILADSGKVKATAGNTFSWTPPKKVLQDDTAYQAQFFAWDAVARVATPGDPQYVLATRNFTVDDDAAVAAPVITAVDQATAMPILTVHFTRSVAPDSFTIYRDGEVVDADVDPAEISTGGTSYAWTEPAASPLSTHSYRVRAVASDVQSVKSNEVTATVAPEGLWLISQDQQTSVVITGLGGVESWEVQDQVAVYEVHGRSKPVVVRTAFGALRGRSGGRLEARDGRTLAQQRAALAALRASDAPVVMIAADYSGLVSIWNVKDSVHPDTFPGQVVRLVSFEFAEAD